jgi:hypothetical protein
MFKISQSNKIKRESNLVEQSIKKKSNDKQDEEAQFVQEEKESEPKTQNVATITGFNLKSAKKTKADYL